MSDIQPAGDAPDRRFSDMSFKAKLGFIGKAIVFLFSGGFIFPTLWVD